MQAIFRQGLISQTEVIAIDSGSTDDTLSILSRYPIHVLNIEPSTFNHGAVRNLGAQQAKGKYVVMTVQDAEPSDEKWLQHLLDGFDDDRVAGVCGQQIVPHDPDKNPVDWFRPMSEPGIVKYFFSNRAEFDALAAEEKKKICSWDDVNAMYRKDTLLKIPFRNVSFAEDALWARDALQNGYAIVYNTRARVNHYHFETPDYTFRRSFTIHYHFYKFFGIRPSSNASELVSILRNIKLLCFEKISMADKFRWLAYNFRQRKALKRSANLFNIALAKGETELEKKHHEISGIPPQALTQQN
jgi:rhamnosyltransferase